MYFYMDHLHFHVLNAYANVGVSHAQHHVAHKYLNGKIIYVNNKNFAYVLRTISNILPVEILSDFYLTLKANARVYLKPGIRKPHAERRIVIRVRKLRVSVSM